MSRIFEALQQAQSEKNSASMAPAQIQPISEPPCDFNAATGLDRVPSFSITTFPEHRLFVMTDEHSLGAEKVRVLSARLRSFQHRLRVKKVLITSSVSGEGKSMLSANLALTLATRGRKKTLLIGGDLRRPSVGKIFGISEMPGLTEWWRGGESIYDYLRRVEGVPLWLLPAGNGIDQPLEALQSERFSKLMAQMGDWFDWVIIDSPPLFPMADSGLWMNLADGTLLVARVGITPKKLMEKAVESVDKTKLLGIVLNEAAEREEQYYDYYRKEHSLPTGVASERAPGKRHFSGFPHPPHGASEADKSEVKI